MLNEREGSSLKVLVCDGSEGKVRFVRDQSVEGSVSCTGCAAVSERLCLAACSLESKVLKN